jgi:hypothetical protein
MTYTLAVARIRKALEQRLTFSNEAQFQAALATLFSREEITPYIREHRLGDKERLDFYLPQARTAIEVKMWVSTAEVARQLRRYAAHPEIDGIILIARRPYQLPPALAGKPVACLDLWRSAL